MRLLIRVNVAILVCCCARPVFADAPLSAIDLELRVAQPIACLGHPLRVGLYAVSDDDPNSIKSIASLEAIIQWDPAYLQLLGNVDPGAPTWVFSGFFVPDSFGLNESNPPQDGDGIYTALAPGAPPIYATPEGLLITTFEFATVAETAGTPVELLANAGTPVGRTRVYSASGPNLEVTGDLFGIAAQIVEIDCRGDLDGDLDVDLADLQRLLAFYGSLDVSYYEGDLDCDGDVDLADLQLLLSAYGSFCDPS